jgi:ADP-heptose:LPS heptosyltransferase
VPLFGGGGTGEFVRAAALAGALAERWPQARIEFVLPREARDGVAAGLPFKIWWREDLPGLQAGERASSATGLPLDLLRPDVLVLDGGVRSATLRDCRRLGIRVMYLSDRAGTRRKAFRLDVLRLIDVHVHQREHLDQPAFTPWQTLLGRLSRTRRVCVDAIFPEQPTRPHGARSPLDRSDAPTLPTAPFVLYSPGGGGYALQGRPVGEVFVEIAARLQHTCGLPGLVVMGPAYRQALPVVAGLTIVRSLPQSSLHQAMRQAEFVVMNGGAGLHLALHAGAACIAAPLGGDDQPERIGRCAEAGWVLPAAAEAAALTDAALLLAGDPALRQRLQGALAAQPVVNGFGAVLDALVELAGPARRLHGPALSPSHLGVAALPEQVDKVLVCEVAGLGDNVHLLPALWLVRQRWPHAELHVMVGAGLQSLLQLTPWVDRVWAYPRSPKPGLIGQWRLGRMLRRERFDVVIDTKSTDRSSLLCWLSRAPVRLGRRPSDGGPLGWRHCFTGVMDQPYYTQPMYQQKWQCLRNAGFAGEKAPHFEVRIDAGLRRQAGIAAADDQGYLHVSPCTSSSERELPPAQLAELIDAVLQTAPALKLVLSCATSAREHAVMDALITQLSARGLTPWRVFRGELDLPGLAALIDGCRLHLCGDTGSLHLAMMTGTPALAWFRSHRGEREWIPQHGPYRVVIGPADSPRDALHGLRSADLVAAAHELLALPGRVTPSARAPDPHTSRPLDR